MGKATKGNTSYGIKIIRKDEVVAGLVYEFEGEEHTSDEFEIRLRYYYLNEYRKYVWEDFETITSEELFKLIRNGQNPFEWLARKAKRRNSSYKMYMEEELHRQLLKELARCKEHLKCEEQRKMTQMV